MLPFHQSAMSTSCLKKKRKISLQSGLGNSCKLCEAAKQRGKYKVIATVVYMSMLNNACTGAAVLILLKTLVAGHGSTLASNSEEIILLDSKITVC